MIWLRVLSEIGLLLKSINLLCNNGTAIKKIFLFGDKCKCIYSQKLYNVQSMGESSSMLASHKDTILVELTWITPQIGLTKRISPRAEQLKKQKTPTRRAKQKDKPMACARQNCHKIVNWIQVFTLKQCMEMGHH